MHRVAWLTRLQDVLHARADCAVDARMGKDVEAVLLYGSEHRGADVVGRQAPGAHRFAEHLLPGRLLRGPWLWRVRKLRGAVAFRIGDAGGHVGRTQYGAADLGALLA